MRPLSSNAFSVGTSASNRFMSVDCIERNYTFTSTPFYKYLAWHTVILESQKCCADHWYSAELKG
jgi:hypothetical protein